MEKIPLILVLATPCLEGSSFLIKGSRFQCWGLVLLLEGRWYGEFSGSLSMTCNNDGEQSYEAIDNICMITL